MSNTPAVNSVGFSGGGGVSAREGIFFLTRFRRMRYLQGLRINFIVAIFERCMTGVDKMEGRFSCIIRVDFLAIHNVAWEHPALQTGSLLTRKR